jgi:hypothetical protein
MPRALAVLLSSVALAAAGAGVLSGCGANEVTKVARVDVAKAAQLTAAKKTARMQISIQISGMGLAQPTTLTADGVTDLTASRGTFNMDFATLLKSFGAPAELLGSGDTKLQLRLDGSKIYAKLPDIPLLTSFLNGKHWISLDAAGLGQQLGLDTKGLGDFFSISPAARLRVFRSLKALKDAGSEQIDGVKTEHYKGSYSLREFTAALPAAQRAAIQDALKKLDALSGANAATAMQNREQALEIWVDDAGIVRQTTARGGFGGSSGVPAADFAMTYKLTDFGVPLDVSAPPAGDTYVVTADAISKLLGAASGFKTA